MPLRAKCCCAAASNLGSHGLVGKQNIYEHSVKVPYPFSRGQGASFWADYRE